MLFGTNPLLILIRRSAYWHKYKLNKTHKAIYLTTFVPSNFHHYIQLAQMYYLLKSPSIQLSKTYNIL